MDSFSSSQNLLCWGLLQTCVNRIRLDMPVTDADFIAQTTDDIEEAVTVTSPVSSCFCCSVMLLWDCVALMASPCLFDDVVA